MYSIEKKPFGFKLTFGGFMEKEELERWRKEFVQVLPKPAAKFGIMVDMRTLKPLPADAQEVMVAGQQSAREAGMERSAVILSDVVTTMQFRRLAKASGIHTWERYINASESPKWEQQAMDWIGKGVDPEK